MRAQEHEAMATHSFVNPMLLKKNSCQPSGHEQAIKVRHQEKLEQLLISESARDSEISSAIFSVTVELCRHEDPAPSVKKLNHIALSRSTIQRARITHGLRHRPGLVGACSDAQRLSRGGEQRPGKVSRARGERPGRDARHSGGHEVSCARGERSGHDDPRRDNDPRGGR